MSFTPMAKKKSLQEAISDWEKENEGKKLSLSSNFITKIPDLHFDNLEILSLGRNKIR